MNGMPDLVHFRNETANGAAVTEYVRADIHAAANARIVRLEAAARDARDALRLSVNDWRETDKMLFPEIYEPQVAALAKLDAALEREP